MLDEGRAGCTRKLIDGKPRIPSAEPGNCHDCGVAPGKIHHLGCDSEICPSCGKHLLIDEEHNPDFAGYSEASKEFMRAVDGANLLGPDE